MTGPGVQIVLESARMQSMQLKYRDEPEPETDEPEYHVSTACNACSASPSAGE